MPTKVLSLQHVQQQEDGECLAACADMILRYIGKSIAYNRLVSLLQVKRGLGARSSNIHFLKRLDVTVLYTQGSLDSIRAHLQNGNPCIAFVLTGELPYWSYSVQHALVVVGMDEEKVWIHDPEFEQAPIAISIGDFDLAWLEMDMMFAVIAL